MTEPQATGEKDKDHILHGYKRQHPHRHDHQHSQGHDPQHPHGHEHREHHHHHTRDHSHRHEHALLSSRDDLDAFQILKNVGLQGGNSFLDIGCGDGHFSIAASSIVGEGGTVLAVDSDPQSATILNEIIGTQGITNVHPITADASQGLGIESGTVDLCLISNVMHGFVVNGEAAQVLSGVAQLMKSGGKCVIIEFVKRETPFGPPLEIRLSPEELDEMISPYGFRMVSGYEPSPYHNLVVFTRI